MSSSTGTDSILCRVHEDGAYFTFPQGSNEYMPHSMLHKSSTICTLLSDGDGAHGERDLMLVAPCGYLRSWIDLRRLLTEPTWPRSLHSSDIVKYVKVIYVCSPSSVHQKEGQCAVYRFRSLLHVSLASVIFLPHMCRLQTSSQMSLQ